MPTVPIHCWRRKGEQTKGQSPERVIKNRRRFSRGGGDRVVYQIREEVGELPCFVLTVLLEPYHSRRVAQVELRGLADGHGRPADRLRRGRRRALFVEVHDLDNRLPELGVHDRYYPDSFRLARPANLDPQVRQPEGLVELLLVGRHAPHRLVTSHVASQRAFHGIRLSQCARRLPHALLNVLVGDAPQQSRQVFEAPQAQLCICLHRVVQGAGRREDPGAGPVKAHGPQILHVAAPREVFEGSLQLELGPHGALGHPRHQRCP
mmetsp:Transcript_2355/g.6656  ORF Transcript_2355/g.6656 Transcript_2355/m.6656 type:complete len:264 (+) Transcript_2355:340-1131(+)